MASGKAAATVTASTEREDEGAVVLLSIDWSPLDNTSTDREEEDTVVLLSFVYGSHWTIHYLLHPIYDTIVSTNCTNIYIYIYKYIIHITISNQHYY